MIPRLLHNRWPATLWTVLIFILLVIPDSGLPKRGMLGVPNLDKVAHILLFGGFVVLWHLARPTRLPAVRHPLLLLFAISSAYGIAMEFVQLGFTNRAFEAWDIAADVAGAGAAALGIGFGQKRSPYGHRGRNQN
jgi:VanZ family protein